nr:NERD domain-containing protein [Microlunatus panaciterrae]
MAEKIVAEKLASGRSMTDRLWANQRLTDDRKNAEIDFIVARPDAGVIAVEVKGGQVTHDGDGWTQTSQSGHAKSIDPVTQVRDAMYLLRSYVERDSRWGQRGRVRYGHAVIFPFTHIPEDFSLPDCPRHLVFGRDDLDDLVDKLARIPIRQHGSDRLPSNEDVQDVEEILRGRGLPQDDVLALALERDVLTDHLTQQQGMLLEVSKLMNRMEIRGGAGSGKTWLAMEQARRLTRAGQRVALVCYSRGLAAFFQRLTTQWPRREQPAYVGTFHGLGIDQWGAHPPVLGDEDSGYWEEELPSSMITIAASLPVGRRFDAIVVDEAQDFADRWWAAVLAALKNPAEGGIYVYSDEGQRVFARFGGIPECQAVFMLEHNLRNTRQIADTFQSLALTRMRARGGVGPQARLVPCAAEQAIGTADDAVESLFDEGWRAQDIALLTTGKRHPEQVIRQAQSQDAYWASFWDDDQVFYGHVLGFKGLERRAVVLAVNDNEPRDRARERLYVGLSRARDELVVCGDPEYIEQVAGSALLRKFGSGAATTPSQRASVSA